MKRTASAGGVVLNNRGEVLVVSQHGKAWSLPKGHIEQGEDPPTAAKREITEESGITELALIRELGTYERYKLNEHGQEDRNEWKTITVFLFRTNQRALAPRDPHNPEARWVAKEQVTELLTHQKDKEFFTAVLPQLGTVS